MTCDICCGSRRLRLPVRTPVSLTPYDAAEIPLKMEAAWREYPCPECSGPETAEIAKVYTIKADIEYYPYERQRHREEYERHMLDALAHQLALQIIKNGFMNAEWNEKLNYKYTFQAAKLVGKIGVINPKRVPDAEKDIDALAYDLWAVHPKTIDEWEKTAPPMPENYKGGMRAWYYACNIREAFKC